jgi:ribonuclease E
MSKNERPAVSTGGGSTTPNGDFDPVVIPAKLRVHALAKLLGLESKRVIGVLTDMGEAVRSAQSSVSREIALRVVATLRPELVADREHPPEPSGNDTEPSGNDTEPSGNDTEPSEGGTDEPVAVAVLAPLFAAPQPMFLPAGAADALERTRQVRQGGATRQGRVPGTPGSPQAAGVLGDRGHRDTRGGCRRGRRHRRSGRSSP